MLALDEHRQEPAFRQPLGSNLVLDANPLTPGQHLTDGRRGPVLRQKLVSRTVNRMKVHGMGGF